MLFDIASKLSQLSLDRLIGLSVLLHPLKSFDFSHCLTNFSTLPLIPDILDIVTRTTEFPNDFVCNLQLYLIDLIAIHFAYCTFHEVAVDCFVHQWTGVQLVLHLVRCETILILQKLSEEISSVR